MWRVNEQGCFQRKSARIRKQLILILLLTFIHSTVALVRTISDYLVMKLENTKRRFIVSFVFFSRQIKLFYFNMVTLDVFFRASFYITVLAISYNFLFVPALITSNKKGQKMKKRIRDTKRIGENRNFAQKMGTFFMQLFII